LPPALRSLRRTDVTNSGIRYKKGGIFPPFLYLRRGNSLYRLENIVSPGEE